MATELATAYIALVPSAKGIKGKIESELGGAGTNAAGKTESAFGSASKRISSGIKGAIMGAAVGGAAAFAAIKVGDELLSTGAKVEGFRQKAKTVFEGAAGDVKAWADKNNEAMGLTDDELLGLAGSFGDLLKPMGFTSEQAATMAKDVVGLSGALSSWSGGTVSSAEASDILSKAMLGERDGLKSLGISISEADVQRKLAEKGQQDLTGAALEQAKAVATQELIFAKSTDAQKAWADGGNKALVGQNKLKASFAEAKEQLAGALTPALTAAASWLGDKLPVALAAAKSWFDSIKPTLAEVGAWLKEKIPPAIETLRAAFAVAVAWVQANWPQIKAVVTDALTAVQSVIESVVSVSLMIWKNFGDNVLSYVQAVWGPVQSVIKGALDFIQGIFKAVSSILKGDWGAAWDGIKQAVSGAFEFITGIFGVFREALKLWLGIAVEILSSIWSKAWDGFKSLVKTAIGAVIQYFKDLPGNIVDGLKLLGSTVLAAISAAWKYIWEGDQGAKAQFGRMIQWFKDLPGNAVDGVKELGSKLLAALSAAWSFVWDGSTGMKAQFGNMVAFIKDLPSKIADAAKGMWDGLKTAFRGAINFIIRGWNRLEFKIPGFKIGPVGYDGFTLGLPDIPEFHTGGIVGGTPGQEVLIKALAGERVLSPTQTRAYDAATGAGGPGSGYTFAPTYNGILDPYEASAIANAEWGWRLTLGAA